MKKTTKKTTRKRLKLGTFSVFLFLFSCTVYLCSALFLRSYNNSLSSRKQSIEAQISDLEVQNEAVAVEVNTLNNRERVSAIAADDGLSMNQDNVVTITKTGGD